MAGLSFRPIKHHRVPRRPLPVRLQLVQPAPRVSVLSPPTEFGIDLFDRDDEGQHRCPRGHVAGLNVLSEVTVDRASWPDTDLAATREHYGDPWPADPDDPDSYGLVVPEPILLMSPRLFRLLKTHKLTGWAAEIAYLR